MRGIVSLTKQCRAHFGLDQPMGLEHLNHLLELLIGPKRAQLADAPLISGLFGVGASFCTGIGS